MASEASASVEEINDTNTTVQQRLFVLNVNTAEHNSATARKLEPEMSIDDVTQMSKLLMKFLYFIQLLLLLILLAEALAIMWLLNPLKCGVKIQGTRTLRSINSNCYVSPSQTCGKKYAEGVSGCARREPYL